MAEQTERTTGQSLLQEMGITDQEIAQRKGFLGFRDEDVERLESFNDLAQKHADSFIEDLYKHFMEFEESRTFFRDPKLLEHVKRMQREYFLRLTQGKYDTAYVENRLNIGAVHERINLSTKLYLGAYSFYLRGVGSRLSERYKKEPERAVTTLLSLMKLVFLDMGLAIDTYIYRRERTIRAQQEVILELSTPVLQVREGLLILPIIGAIDTQRTNQLTEQLLHSIRANRAKVVVLDITGVPAVDTAVSNHLLQTVQAARLLGARVIVTGLSANVAQTLVRIGVDLSPLNTVGDLEGGIEEAERLLGYKVRPIEATPEPNQYA